MTMKVSFVINDIETLDPTWDSTLRLMQECLNRGHDVSFLYTRNFFIGNNVIYGYVARVLGMDLSESERFFETLRVERENVPLAEQDVIFLRKDPPIDLTMINFLDLIKADVFIVNDIDWLRRANNKLHLSAFDDPEAGSIIPRTYVSKNFAFLKSVIQNYEEENMVLKLEIRTNL